MDVTKFGSIYILDPNFSFKFIKYLIFFFLIIGIFQIRFSWIRDEKIKIGKRERKLKTKLLLLTFFP